MKLRVFTLMAAVIFTVAVLCAGTATAAELGYSDGSTCAGPLCPGGPPPVAPSWQSGNECKVDLIDPVSYVYVTEHFVYGTTPPLAGVVPVAADAHAVYPYSATPPHLDPVNVEVFVAGKRGFRADTWNIGEGVTAWVPFDCRDPEPTTTTTSTTEAPTTTTTTGSPKTTTTTQETGTGISSPTTLPTARTAASLPNTGSSTGPAIVGLLTLGTGTALVVGARKRRKS